MNDILQEPKRRKKLDLNELWTKCKICLVPYNLEDLIRHKLTIKSSQGLELYGAFAYTYFCSENCKGLFNPT